MSPTKLTCPEMWDTCGLFIVVLCVVRDQGSQPGSSGNQGCQQLGLGYQAHLKGKVKTNI